VKRVTVLSATCVMFFRHIHQAQRLRARRSSQRSRGSPIHRHVEHRGREPFGPIAGGKFTVQEKEWYFRAGFLVTSTSTAKGDGASEGRLVPRI